MDKEEILKKRIKLGIQSKKKLKIIKERIKYGVSTEEAWNLDLGLGYIIYNGLLTYVADAKDSIVRNDFNKILKHAEAIKAYIESDYVDIYYEDNDESLTFDDKSEKYKKRKKEYHKKEKRFKKAMKWIADNFKSLWW